MSDRFLTDEEFERELRLLKEAMIDIFNKDTPRSVMNEYIIGWIISPSSACRTSKELRQLFELVDEVRKEKGLADEINKNYKSKQKNTTSIF